MTGADNERLPELDPVLVADTVKNGWISIVYQRVRGVIRVQVGNNQHFPRRHRVGRCQRGDGDRGDAGIHKNSGYYRWIIDGCNGSWYLSRAHDEGQLQESIISEWLVDNLHSVDSEIGGLLQVGDIEILTRGNHVVNVLPDLLEDRSEINRAVGIRTTADLFPLRRDKK